MRDILVNYAIGTILTVMSDPQAHVALQRAMLKVFKTLWSVYGTTAEFQAVVKPQTEQQWNGL